MTDLNIKQAMDLAIAIERHNGDMFVEWSNRFKPYDLSIAAFFEELSNEERIHENQLIKLYKKYFDDNPDHVDTLPELFNIYLDGLTNIQQHFFVIDAYMADVILKSAWDIEKYTREFYQNLAKSTKNPDLATAFSKLCEFEEGHQKEFEIRIEQQREKLTLEA